MPLADDLVALAALAGNTVVAAAATDAWESVRRGIAGLFGRSGRREAEVAARRLDETRRRLGDPVLSGVDLEAARAELVRLWVGRLADLLEEDPGAEAGLRELVSQVTASDHSVAAGRDVTFTAQGGIAAGVMKAEAVAGPGGTAIGRLEYRRRDVASRPVSLPPRPVFLAGREDLLGRLDDLLMAGPAPRLAALCGLAGVGKSSIAAEYAHRHLAGVGLAWYLPAEDEAVLAAEFGRLARQLGVADPVAPGDPVAAVHGVLAASLEPWLLVFDNAPDEASVRGFLPPAGRGQVLVTSQSAQWLPGQAVEVPVLDTEVAAGFLVSRTGDGDGVAAARLAAELGGLPLALEQAAAYVQAAGSMTLARYLGLYRERRAELLTRGTPAGHAATVEATFTLAFSRLAHKAPSAVHLFRLLACLAPEPIPLDLLTAAEPAAELDPGVADVLEPGLTDPLAVADAVSALRCFSLVTPAGDGMVVMHRLVQAVALGQMDTGLIESWRRVAATLIDTAIPADTKQPTTWPVSTALLPHARAVLDLTSSGTWGVGRYLGYSGNYPAARDLFGEIADAYQASADHGPGHSATLSARHNHARWTGEAGDPASARDQLAALLPVFERSLGPEHRDTLTARDDLARWTGEAGDPASAREQYAALLPVFEQILGPEHIDTLATCHNLARWTGEAGDPASARDQSAALLPVRERILGPEHPHTLITRASLAYWTGEAGDAASARDQCAELLPIRQRVSGPEHPDTLATRANLARYTGQAGDPASGRDQYAELLPIRQRILGPEHPDTLTNKADLAYWTGQAGDAASARDQCAELLPIRQRVSGPEHPDTLATRANLARYTGQAGDPASGRDQYAELLPIRQRILGPEHPDTLTNKADLAYWTGQAGDPASARDQLAELLPIRQRILGPEHPHTLTSRAILARYTGQAGDAVGARDQYAELLPVRERVSGAGHPYTLMTRDDLAFWTRRADEQKRHSM